MDGKRVDTSERSASDKTLLGDQNELPFVEGKSFCALSRWDISGTDQSGACPTLAEIQEWTDGANISSEHLAKLRTKSESSTLGDLRLFARHNKNIYHRQARAYLEDREANAAIKKIEMAKQYGCNHLECDLCNKSFQSESDFIKHHNSEEHLAKVPLECNLNMESFQSVADLREHCDNEESPGLPAATNVVSAKLFF